jgi:chlorophyll/bacteriochlorophyll a synthase
MTVNSPPSQPAPVPSVSPAVALELLKPVTWFPPMWAFACGVVASGVSPAGKWPLIAVGVLLAGPLVCGASQVVNDWFDRHVDAINEPQRPIPSGRAPGRFALHMAIAWSALALIVAALLGQTVFLAGLVGMALAWAYSAPPFRLKLNGWWGGAACGLCYEGLAWITGTAVMTGGALPSTALTLALLYSLGAHGIMTLNDFKSIEGDRQIGVRTLPVQLGAERAALVACAVMAFAQVLVIACLIAWDRTAYGLAIGALLAAQIHFMRRLLTNPAALAPWYNATGIGLFVSGMMISAVAVRSM